MSGKKLLLSCLILISACDNDDPPPLENTDSSEAHRGQISASVDAGLIGATTVDAATSNKPTCVSDTLTNISSGTGEWKIDSPKCFALFFTYTNIACGYFDSKSDDITLCYSADGFGYQVNWNTGIISDVYGDDYSGKISRTSEKERRKKDDKTGDSDGEYSVELTRNGQTVKGVCTISDNKINLCEVVQ